MANNGYHIVKALREEHIDAELIINTADFGMGLPMWEEISIQMDPYNVDFNKLIEKWPLPEWIKTWKYDKNNSVYNYTSLFKLTKPYDLLHLHPPTPMYLQFTNKPKIIHEAGWVRLFHLDTPTHKLGRRAYQNADCIIYTNPDTYPLIEKLNCKRVEFIPFVIPPEQYKPGPETNRDELLFFHPTRHVWDVKGNDKLLKAFGQFIKEGYRAKLRLVDWGWDEDVEKSKLLIKKLGIEKYVEWVNPYTKPDLIKAYHESDAIFDQFILGSGGTTCYEAMSCSKPLAIYLNHWNEKCFGEMPPVINVCNIKEIHQTMIDLTDEKYRRNTGSKGRTFTLKYNNPKTIAENLIKIYMEVRK